METRPDPSPISDMTLESSTVDHTVAIGARLGAALLPGDVVCLSGDLGAGKTAFTRGVGVGWGAIEQVSSPTFVFAHEHRRDRDSIRLIHIDCYRLSQPEGADSIGIDDILSGDHVVVIEWPERIAPLLPPDHLWIELVIPDLDSDLRTLQITAIGARALILVKALET